MSIPILMYHQIDVPPPRGTRLRGLVVAPTSFVWQMKMLSFMGYRGLSMSELEPYLMGCKRGKVVGITFDDGYCNNVENALPVLLDQGFTATCYGVSGFIGGTNIWDRGIMFEKPLMSSRDWQRWLDAGMDVGSHTRSHAKLTELSDVEARAQIVDSKHELERAIGCEVRHFCYPYGAFRAAHQQMVLESGYVTATSTHRGRVHLGDDLFTLKRVMVARATHPLLFFLKVATSYEDLRA